MKTEEITNPYDLAETLGIRYVGDCNIEHGGLFYDTTNWSNYGYATALRITDLDSACGFPGGIIIERITILKDKLEDALEYCSVDLSEVSDREAAEVEACEAYGLFDPHVDYNSPSSIIISTDPESMEFDGWKAEKHIAEDDLLGFIHAEWMNDF